MRIDILTNNEFKTITEQFWINKNNIMCVGSKCNMLHMSTLVTPPEFLFVHKNTS